jgi:hypothetical protein
MPGFDIGGPGPDKPPDPTGAFRASEHVPHLVAFAKGKEEESGGQSKFTVVACPFAVCLTCHIAWDDVTTGARQLRDRILSSTHEIVLVRLNQGEAKADQSPPIFPEDPVPVEQEEAQAVFDKYGAKLPSGKVVFDTVSYNHDHKPLTP